MSNIEIALKDYFGESLYNDIEKYQISQIIKMCKDTKILQIIEKNKHKNFYLQKLKFNEIYKDLKDGKVDITLKKYHYEMVSMLHFKKAKTLYKYVTEMVKKNDKD